MKMRFFAINLVKKIFVNSFLAFIGYTFFMNENLTYEMRNSLLLRHKTERDGRIKDRIKAVLLFDDGCTYSAIAK